MPAPDGNLYGRTALGGRLEDLLVARPIGIEIDPAPVTRPDWSSFLRRLTRQTPEAVSFDGDDIDIAIALDERRERDGFSIGRPPWGVQESGLQGSQLDRVCPVRATQPEFELT